MLAESHFFFGASLFAEGLGCFTVASAIEGPLETTSFEVVAAFLETACFFGEFVGFLAEMPSASMGRDGSFLAMPFCLAGVDEGLLFAAAAELVLGARFVLLLPTIFAALCFVPELLTDFPEMAVFLVTLE